MISTVARLLFSFTIFVTVSEATLLVKITPRPSAKVNVGDRVELLCNFNGTFDREYVVTWKHGEDIMGEACSAYHKRYRITCSPGNYATAMNFDYVIKSVEWRDRGSWTCAYKFNDSTINLNVRQPAKLLDLKPLAQKPDKPLEGSGTRVNPYNLMNGPSTQFQCTTGCGYPASTVKWSYSNKTSSGVLTSFSSSSTSTNLCKGSDAVGMLTVTSTLTINNCSQMGLYGHLKITCTASGMHYRSDEVKHFYIACPGTSSAQPYGGMAALTLTHGEIIGIAVGCALAFILTFLAIVWFNRKRLKAHEHQTV